MTYIKTTLLKVFINAANFSSYNGIIKATLAALWVYFAGVKLYLISIPVLVILDVITGIIASKKKGIPFTSKELKKGLLYKTALYIIMLIGTLVLESLVKSIFSYSAYFLVFFISFLIGCYELISVMENILAINPNLVFIQAFIKLTNSLQKKVIDKAEKAVEEGSSPEEKK